MFGAHSQGIEVYRQALYEQVWSTPMTKLAEKYRISDVGFAKICKKLKVPYPGRGYWRKKETGKAVKQPPLPPNSDPIKESVTIYPSPQSDVATKLSADIVQRTEAELTEEKKIFVPGCLLNPHHLLKAYLSEWRKPQVDEYGAIVSGNIRKFGMRVSPKSLDRALRIMDTLFKALESRGYPVGIQDGYHKTLGACINGESIEFGLEERFTRIDNPDHNNARVEYWMRGRYRYVPTGSLFLRIGAWGTDGLQKSWSDGKTATVESCLNDFVVGLLKVAEVEKARRLEREKQERRWLEAERRRQKESERRQALEQEIEKWAKVQQLRAYLAAKRRAYVTKHGEILAGSKAEQWFAWAHRYADRLDPLVLK
jgi:hypothetical protein